jgi:hypothetical protein
MFWESRQSHESDTNWTQEFSRLAPNPVVEAWTAVRRGQFQNPPRGGGPAETDSIAGDVGNLV